MEVKPSEKVLTDYNDEHEVYLLNKILLNRCEDIANDDNSTLDIKTKDCMKQIFIESEMDEYSLNENSDSKSNNYLLGLTHLKTSTLSKCDTANLVEFLNSTLRSKFSSYLEKLDSIFHGVLSKCSSHDELNLRIMELCDKLSEKYLSLIRTKQQHIELNKRLIRLQESIMNYDTIYSLDLLHQDHIKEDKKISTLTNFIEHETFHTSPHTLNASSIVMGDIEQEIRSIEDQLKQLE